MTTIEKQDVVVTGLDYLIDFWENKPVARGIARSYLKEIQNLEDVVYKLLTERGIFSAIGVQLDRLGLLAGERRGGRGDEDYRLAILNRLAINNSDGTIPVILDILKSLTLTENPTLFEHYPALVISQIDSNPSHKIAKINDEIMAAGVCGLLSFNHGNTAFVGAELTETSEFYRTDDGHLIELDDGSFLAIPSFKHEWDNGYAFFGELGEENVNPLAELLDKKDYYIDQGIYIDNNNDAILLDDGSVLLWQTREEI